MSDSTTAGLKKPLGKFSSLLFHFVSPFLSEFKESLKCDLNPVFRRKGALLWPPLHPSPHFHPLCLGPRMKLLKRLSTPSFSPHRVGRSKSTRSPWLYLPLPFAHSALSSLLYAAHYLPCCMSRPSARCRHHQPHPRLNRWNCGGFVKTKPLPASLLKFEQKVALVMQHSLILTLPFFAPDTFEAGDVETESKLGFLFVFVFFLKTATCLRKRSRSINKCLYSEPPTACSHFCYTQPNILHLLIKVKTKKTKSCKYEYK